MTKHMSENGKEGGARGGSQIKISNVDRGGLLLNFCSLRNFQF